MADTKISDLAAVTSLVGTDDFVLARAGDTKRIVASDLALFLGAGTDGWTPDAVTWTYASATTFTVSGDVTAQFSKGTRLKLTQTTVKYFVVAASSHAAGTTTVTITGGTSYTLANAAITLPYYSYAANPQGYPGLFAYTPTWGGFSADPSVDARFSIVGRECFLQMEVVSHGTSNATTFTFSLPIASLSSFPVLVVGVNNSAAVSGPSRVALAAASATATCHQTMTSTAWTASGLKSIQGAFSYGI